MIEKLKGAFHWLLELLFWIIIFVCMATSLLVVSYDGRIPQMRRFGVVQSGSMKASGVERGDLVFVDKRDKEYAVGDIVVFFYAPFDYDKPAKEADLKTVSVWVHQVIDVGEDETGRKTYLTKGTSNRYDDGYYVPQDFVLGKAVPLPDIVGTLFQFLYTPLGIVLTIVLPSGTLFVLFTIEFIRLFIEMYKEIDAEEDENEQKRKNVSQVHKPQPMYSASTCAAPPIMGVSVGNCCVCKCAQCPMNQTCGFCVACRVGRTSLTYAAYAAQQTAAMNLTNSATESQTNKKQ